MEDLRRTYAAPGARTAEVVRECGRLGAGWASNATLGRLQLQPSPAVPHESKRQGVLVQEDTFLVGGMKELDEQTREKNREFSRRIVRGPLPRCRWAPFPRPRRTCSPQSDLIARRKRTAERLVEEAGERDEEIARIRVRA